MIQVHFKHFLCHALLGERTAIKVIWFKSLGMHQKAGERKLGQMTPWSKTSQFCLRNKDTVPLIRLPVVLSCVGGSSSTHTSTLLPSLGSHHGSASTAHQGWQRSTYQALVLPVNTILKLNIIYIYREIYINVWTFCIEFSSFLVGVFYNKE